MPGHALRDAFVRRGASGGDTREATGGLSANGHELLDQPGDGVGMTEPGRMSGVQQFQSRVWGACATRRAASGPPRGSHGRTRTPRESLRAEVRRAAAEADNGDQFVEQLEAAGVVVSLRHSTINEGQITGYSVGWPSDRTASGDQVMFGGSKLAKNLSWPKLHQRWEAEPDGTDPWRAAVDAANQAVRELERGQADVDKIEAAVGDLLDAAAANTQRKSWQQAAIHFRRPAARPTQHERGAARTLRGDSKAEPAGADLPQRTRPPAAVDTQPNQLRPSGSSDDYLRRMGSRKATTPARNARLPAIPSTSPAMMPSTR